MTKFRVILMASVVLGLAAASQATIVGTAHDFSAGGTGGFSGGQICVPCHVPHDNGTGTFNKGPLWNHSIPANSTYKYTVYTSDGTLNTSTATSTQLDNSSMLCMGCHDGGVALDSFGGTTGSQYIQGKARLVKTAGDLSGSHPMGTMTDVAVDASGNWAAGTSTGMAAPNTWAGSWSTTTNTWGGDLTQADATKRGNWDTTKQAFKGSITLKPSPTAGKWVVACLTCHSVHGGSYSHMLRVPQSGFPVVLATKGVSVTYNGSTLCVNCHRM